MGIVAVEQQIRSDQRHFLPRQEEHTRFQNSNQSSINEFFTKKRPHPAAIESLLKSNKRLRKPDWGNFIPVRENVPEAAQLACYWLSNRIQSPLGLLPKGKTTSWCFQSPRCGLAVLTHGNQKDPCLSKLYIVGFAIIYYVVYLFDATIAENDTSDSFGNISRGASLPFWRITCMLVSAVVVRCFDGQVA